MSPLLTMDAYWMGRDTSHAADLTPEIVRNAAHLLRRVNTLIALMHDVELSPHPVTGTPISSGWRPPAVNASMRNAAPRSRHMSGQAVDMWDPEGEIDAWCFEHQDLLAEVGLWLEHPSATKSWAHLQSTPPRSGRRIFYP